jgi:hypothetical protein
VAGFSGEAIRDVVNIGIGGSDLGPKMVVRALAAYGRPGLRMHFVSNLDSAQLAPLLDSLDPRSTCSSWRARPSPPRRPCSTPTRRGSGCVRRRASTRRGRCRCILWR